MHKLARFLPFLRWFPLSGEAIKADFMAGITVVAVPIFASTGRLTHTLAAVGLSSHLTAATTVDLVTVMQREAAAIAGLLLDRA